MENAFWMVWCPDRGAPTAKHDTEESATREAERLARVNPGHRFYVLRSVLMVRKVDVERVPMRGPMALDEPPF